MFLFLTTGLFNPASSTGEASEFLKDEIEA